MEFKPGTPVISMDGHNVGMVEHVLMAPGTRKVTHLIVQQGWVMANHKVVPVSWVSAAKPDHITLTETAQVFRSQPKFEAIFYTLAR